MRVKKCRCHLLYADVISFFVTRKNWKITPQNWRKYLLSKKKNLLTDLRNFNEIFRKDVTYDNIKSLQKTRFRTLSLSLWKVYFWRNQKRGEGQFNHSPAFLGLSSPWKECKVRKYKYLKYPSWMSVSYNTWCPKKNFTCF